MGGLSPRDCTRQDFIGLPARDLYGSAAITAFGCVDIFQWNLVWSVWRLELFRFFFIVIEGLVFTVYRV